MDWLTGIAPVAKIIGIIVTFFRRFSRAKKKTQEPVSTTNSPGATVVENSPKTTVIKDSPGAINIGRDVNVFNVGGDTGKEIQNILQEREVQTRASVAPEVTKQIGEIHRKSKR